MTTPLSDVKNNKLEVIVRRIKSNTKGLGYWSAIDALKYLTTAERDYVNSQTKQGK